MHVWRPITAKYSTNTGNTKRKNMPLGFSGSRAMRSDHLTTAPAGERDMRAGYGSKPQNEQEF